MDTSVRQSRCRESISKPCPKFMSNDHLPDPIDLPVVLFNDRGDVQSRTTFSQFARDNIDAMTLGELCRAADILTSGGEVRFNMGAGGVFILRPDAKGSP